MARLDHIQHHLDNVRARLDANPPREEYDRLKQVETSLLKDKFNQMFKDAAKRTAKYGPFREAVIAAARTKGVTFRYQSKLSAVIE